MKAVQYSRFGSPEVLEIVDLPDPHPGPGQIRVAVRAAGVNPTDTKVRKGVLGGDLPRTTGSEVAGVVDEIGEGVTDVALGDRVFGFSNEGAGAAEFALVSFYAPIPASLDFADVAVLPSTIEVASRTLDRLKVGVGTTLLINGAAGGIGSAAIQLAMARGAGVIGVDAPNRHDHIRSLGALPVTFGGELVQRVRSLVPAGVNAALDIAGNGILPELIELTGDPERVVTIADFDGAEKYGVTFSRGDDGRAIYAISEIGGLIESGRFSLPPAHSYPLSEIAEAHRIIEEGRAMGKVVVLVG